MIGDAERVQELERENAELRAKLARYEAPGPALLVAEHAYWCPRADHSCAQCICYRVEREIAYGEQHARCVAVVERMLAEATAPPPSNLDIGQRIYVQGERSRDAEVLRLVLAALRGEP